MSVMIDRRTLIAAAPALAVLNASSALAADQKVITAPILLLHNRILIVVSINGSRPLRFALDSGDAVHASIAPRIARELGLTASGAVRAAGIVGDDVHPVYVGHNVVIGGVMRQDEVLFDEIATGNEMDGLLPVHLLATQDADIDFTKGELRLYFGGEANREGFTPIPYDSGRGGRSIIVECRLDNRPIRLQVDTGAPNALTLEPNIVRDRQLWSAYPRYLEGFARGTAGSTRARTVKMQSFEFAGRRFRDPIVELLDPEHSTGFAAEADGLIGLDLMRRFDLSFQSFPRKTLWVKANAMLTEPFEVDRSGLVVARSKDGDGEVVSVAPGSAAEAAGFKRGDRLPEIRGPAQLRSLEWRLSDGAGAQTPLVVLRDGQRQTLTLTLADRL